MDQTTTTTLANSASQGINRRAGPFALKSHASAGAVSGMLLPHCTLLNPWQPGCIEHALPGTCHGYSSCQDSWGLSEKLSPVKICGARDDVHLPSPRPSQSSAFLKLIPDPRIALCSTQHDGVLLAVQKFIL